jgi:hypothetical protein
MYGRSRFASALRRRKARKIAGALARPAPITNTQVRLETSAISFADALTAAIRGDDRLTPVTSLPADGLKIVMNKGLSVQDMAAGLA